MPLEKIDIRSIVVGHLNTLRDYGTQKRSVIDLLLFFLVPFAVVCRFSVKWRGVALR